MSKVIDKTDLFDDKILRHAISKDTQADANELYEKLEGLIDDYYKTSCLCWDEVAQVLDLLSFYYYEKMRVFLHKPKEPLD